MNVCALCDDYSCAVCHNATVAEERHNFLRAWRKKRGLTLEQLADMVETDKSVIYLLETGQRPLSDKWLIKLADALRTTQGRILDVDPEDIGADIWDWMDKSSKQDRARGLRILRGLTGND